MKKILAATLLMMALLWSASYALAQTPPDKERAAMPQQAPAVVQEQAAPASPPAAAQPKPSWAEYKTPYIGENNVITNPHRTTDEIALWAQQTAADVLSFTQKNYQDQLLAYQKYFVPEGWQLYAEYLKSSTLLSMVANDGYSVGTLVTDTPEVVNQGPAAGAYNWIVKVPITVSLFQTDADGNTKTGSSSKHTLFMNLRRIENPTDDIGIAISNWRVDEVQK